MEIASTIKRIAFLGDHLPRQCGIATFTSDICEAVAVQYPHCQCMVGAVNDRPEGYDYPAQVRFEIEGLQATIYSLYDRGWCPDDGSHANLGSIESIRAANYTVDGVDGFRLTLTINTTEFFGPLPFLF